MCGIAGVHSSSTRIERMWLERMQRCLLHRGPDDTGIEVFPGQGVALAHTRLSIIDLSMAGHQPMHNDEKTVGLVFNGEIYNFPDLRRQLEQLGMAFRSRTDTEVILKGYEAWGINIVHQLNGMFALAIWDERQSVLWLVRDRLGKKPLYWWHDTTRKMFAFASEIKALLELPCIERRINADALHCYLSLGYIPGPYTIFENIYKLSAAHYLRYDGKLADIQRYWEVPSLGIWKTQRNDYRRAVREIVEESIERRLMSDVPLGAFLSGGVDSSIVVGIMSRLMKEPVHTFAAAFDIGPRSFKYNVDADTAEVVSQRFGTKHTRLTVRAEDGLLDRLKQAIWHMDEPHANPTNVTTYLLMQLVKEHGITVILSGDGGDELFAGYQRYLYDRYISWLCRIPSICLTAGSPLAALVGKKDLFQKVFAKAQLPPCSSEWYLSWWEQFSPGERRTLLQPAWHEGMRAPDRCIEQVLGRISSTDDQELLSYADLSLWIAEESNMRMDKMSMAHALETRAPFLDYTVVETAMSIPFKHKVGLWKSKTLLKEAFADLLPEIVLERPKWGWFSPVYYWIKDLLWQEATQAIKWLPETGIFSPQVVTLVETYPSPQPQKIWMLMVFALWYQRFLR